MERTFYSCVWVKVEFSKYTRHCYWHHFIAFTKSILMHGVISPPDAMYYDKTQCLVLSFTDPLNQCELFRSYDVHSLFDQQFAFNNVNHWVKFHQASQKQSLDSSFTCWLIISILCSILDRKNLIKNHYKNLDGWPNSIIFWYTWSFGDPLPWCSNNSALLKNMAADPSKFIAGCLEALTSMEGWRYCYY